MRQRRIGIEALGTDSAAILATIRKAEEAGISGAWLITIGAGLDAITLFASAAVETQKIMFGTCVTPTFPRHPVVMAQQAQVIEELAPGRFRLGVGPSRRAPMERIFGLDYRAPLGHLREYLRILKALLQQGAVDFEGRYYRAHAEISSPVDIPVMASALGPKSFELCGAEADGAITWLCPRQHLRDVAVPRLRSGAQQAGRPVPSLVAHTPVCVNENFDEVRDAMRRQFARYALAPHFQQFYTDWGFPEVSEGTWSDEMIDALVPWGSESRVAESLKELFSLGVDEILVSPVPAGDDREASHDRTLRLLAQVGSEVTRG